MAFLHHFMVNVRCLFNDNLYTCKLKKLWITMQTSNVFREVTPLSEEDCFIDYQSRKVRILLSCARTPWIWTQFYRKWQGCPPHRGRFYWRNWWSGTLLTETKLGTCLDELSLRVQTDSWNYHPIPTRIYFWVVVEQKAIQLDSCDAWKCQEGHFFLAINDWKVKEG